MELLTCKLGNNIINCYDGKLSKEQLKKWSNKNILICPACGKVYEYCHGEVISPYFRHKDKEECEDKYSEPETDEHINGKIKLYEWIKKQNGVANVVLEGWIPETKQRPDIMFIYNGNQYVIEYQCTPISTEYHERHTLYQTAGINDIWICGTDKYLEKDEIGKTFRTKEIEKQTNYYYDSKFNIFVINKDYFNIPKLSEACEYYDYRNECDRENFDGEIIKDYSKFYISLNNIIFIDGKIQFNEEYIKNKIDKYEKKIIERDKNLNNRLKIYRKIIDVIKNNHSLEMNTNRYDSNIIEYLNNCFEININENKYIYKTKYFIKEKYCAWNGRKMAQREKWICKYSFKDSIEYETISEEEFLNFITRHLKDKLKI